MLQLTFGTYQGNQRDSWTSRVYNDLNGIKAIAMRQSGKEGFSIRRQYVKVIIWLAELNDAKEVILFMSFL